MWISETCLQLELWICICCIFWKILCATSRQVDLRVDSILRPSVLIMSFRQQIARKTVNLQQAYDAETQRLLQLWVTEIKEEFIRHCEAEEDRRQFSCQMSVCRPEQLQSRGVRYDLLQQQLHGVLAELGFHDGAVRDFCHNHGTQACMIAQWSADDATSTAPEPMPTASGGTCVTCPICHEHRPAVVLVPCGHVVCRDCQHSKQLRQCPMCRKVITSASQGLFMD